MKKPTYIQTLFKKISDSDDAETPEYAMAQAQAITEELLRVLKMWRAGHGHLPVPAACKAIAELIERSDRAIDHAEGRYEAAG